MKTKYRVGDMFLDRNDKPFCYIVKIIQYKKRSQYEHEMVYFNEEQWSKSLCTLFLNDLIRYGGWKHIPVVK
jgi:hypothetical protein